MHATQPQAYQLKITLKYSKPPIWRRLLVADDSTLEYLHHVIQAAMGWENDHLHQFIVNDRYFGPRHGYMRMDDVEDEGRIRLREIAPAEGSRFLYEYDFGDGWEHVILVEKILPRDPEQPLPVCLKGVRACPPEDIGGVWGYDAFLEAIRDPEHPEHDDYAEWVGESFDPEAFDLEAVNATLSRMAAQRKASRSRRSRQS
jgi:hypothetical protein